MRLGILSLQGAFAEHAQMLRSLGADTFEIRKPSDLQEQMDGIVIPGGESTAMGLLLRDMGMLAPLREIIQNGMPVMGTCAGAILLADSICGQEEPHLATMPVTIRRNAYGRQLGSFSAVSEFKGCGSVPMRFIRAPVIDSLGDGVELLAEVDGSMAAARYGNQIIMTFHPEISGDPSIHNYFLDICKEHRAAGNPDMT